MVFSSLLFLFWFIPIFFIIYYIAPARFKNVVLFAGSIVFYAWGEPEYLLLIAVSIIVNYAGGRLIEHFEDKGAARKITFIATMVFDFGMLMIFKYTNFFVENINRISGAGLPEVDITLPLGISFYTFQIASYVIDLYRREIKCEHNILNLATYLVMFPQLIAGPIVVYSQVSAELGKRRVTPDDIEDGLATFIIGLGSKVLIANNCGALWDDIGTIGYEEASMGLCWLGVIAYTLQIFFDFNGYSLMAIGLGRMLGFNIPKNFDYPYISKSITEFWRRWHMTLSGWFRDYVYIPLGGNRKGTVRTYVNLFIVWFLTGFWHGAGWNFILWGLFFFVILVLEKQFYMTFLKKHPIFARTYALLLIGLSWMIFAITDIGQLGVFFTRLVSFDFADDVIYYLRNYGAVLIIGCIFSTPLFRNVYYKYKKKPVGVIALLAIFIVSVCYLADASFNPFLYFRF